MKYLIPLLFIFSFAHADDSEYCRVKAYLAKDIVTQINDGLDPSNINFAFPNVRSQEEEYQAMNFVNKLMQEVRLLMKEGNDAQTIHDKIKDHCEDPYANRT